MKISLFGRVPLLGIGVLLTAVTSSVSEAAVTFTGNVPADFTGAGVITVVDPGGVDVDVPSQFPPGTVSGNDLADVRFYLDTTTDTLFVGMNTYVIAGDVDGDGDPSGTSATLAGIGGQDLPDFGGTEAFAVMFDIDEDGQFDVIAGVSAMTDLSGFTVAAFSGSPFAPGFAFGASLTGHTGTVFGSPSVSAPHIEFTILNFSSLPTSSGSDSAGTVGINAFVGSFSDAGIGEDFVPSVGSTASIPLPEPSSLLLLGVGLSGIAMRRLRR